MIMIWILWSLILPAAASDHASAFTSQNGSCQIYYQSETSLYEASCSSKGVVHSKKIKLTPTTELQDDFQSLKDFVISYSSDKTTDEEKLKELVLKNFESKMRFEYPGDEALIKKAMTDLAELNSGLTYLEECDDSQNSLISPFVDLKLDASSFSHIEQKLVDEKMAQDGFYPLGKLKSIGIQVGTENDNFLLGLGQAAVDVKNKSPWWEGDDHGYTSGIDLAAQMNFDFGHVKLSSYTNAYSELSSVDTPYGDQGIDETGKTYSNFLSLDGAKFEVRVNQLTGDKYVKLIGSVEHLTDSNHGMSQKIQKEWHRLGNVTQYHYLDHRESETRYQAGLALGMEKSAKPLNWMGIKWAIEGETQASTSGLKNSYVGVATELSVNSNQLFRSSNHREPVLEATLKADHKHYGTNQTYTTIGVTFYGTIYSDQQGNIVKVFAGIKDQKDPLTERYSQDEINWKGRADLIHTLGVKYERKF